MAQKNVHIVIQARVGSMRLPGKVLLPFVGQYTFLEWVVKRCLISTQATKVIVATTTSPKDDAIEALCKEKGFAYMRGSEDDVLARYFAAAQQFGSEIIIRVNSDCPLIDVTEMDRAIEILQAEQLEYANTHPGGLPVGMGAEVFTRVALEKVAKQAKDPYEHEHVTPYFYRHPELFKQKEVAALNVHTYDPSTRFALDTPQDLEFLTQLAKELNFSNPKAQPSTNDILAYLELHPELIEINKAIVQKTFPKA